MSRTRRNHSGYTDHIDSDKIGRDGEPASHPPSWFKKMKRRRERSSYKQALRQGYEPDPIPKSDLYDWW